MRNRNWPLAVLMAFSAISAAPLQAAESYPSRPIRFIVPFAPRGSNDTIARLFAQHLTEHLGNSVVVDNRAGAGSIVGNEIAANSQPDGHTIVIISASFAFSSALHKKLPFDPIKSFSPVSKIATGPVVLAVNPGLPVKTVKELLALVAAKPGQLNFASSGVGSAQHLGMELLKTLVKFDVVHVPFKGGGPATLSVMTGDSHISLGSVISLIPHIRSGKLRAIATGGQKRSSALPDLPTVDEAGVKGYETVAWGGIVGPHGLPADIVAQLNAAVNRIVALPAVRERYAKLAVETMMSTPNLIMTMAKLETPRWADVIKRSGAKVE